MTDTAVATRADTPRRVPESPYRLSFLRLVRSEAIKLVTLRSPWWSIAVVAVLSIGMSLLIAWALTSIPEANAGSFTAAQAAQTVLAPTSFTVLLATIVGSIQVTGEYSTGMIRSTLTAAPRRIGSLLAKATIVAVFVFVSSLVIFVIAAFATAPLLSNIDVHFDLGDPENSILPLIAGAFTMAIISLLGVSAGYLLRNGPGAIALGVGLVFVLPLVPAFFPAVPDWQWIHDIARFLPTNAGQSLMISGGALEQLPALLTLVAWAVVGLVSGAIVLKSRDA